MQGLDTIKWISSHPLSDGKRARNIARFISWQVRSRALPRPRTFDFVNGTKMWAVSGMTGATGNLYVGLHDFNEMAFALHFLRPDDLFADVGANVGSYTVLALSTGARTISFEPGDAAFDWLTKNVRMNAGSSNATLVKRAVGATPGTASFTSGLDVLNKFDRAGNATVTVTTVDAACDETPALMKIDVEGFESDVLRGSQRFMKSGTNQAAIIEINAFETTDMMRDAGFQPYRYDPYARSLMEHRAPSYGNVIFIQDIDAARARVQEAPAFTIRGTVI